MFKFKSIKNKNAQALIFGYIALLFLAILAASFFARSINEKNLALRQKLTTEAIYLAEGTLEDAIYQFGFGLANKLISPDDIDDDGIDDNDAADLEAIYSVSTTFTAAPFAGATGSSTIEYLKNTNRTGTEYEYLAYWERKYLLTTTVQHPKSSAIRVTLNQVINRQLRFLFQHAIFYTKDLEILPGPNMEFSGCVHSNQNIYVDCNGILTIDSEYFHAHGEIYNQRKNDPTIPIMGDNSVSIKVKGSGDPGTYVTMPNNINSTDPTWNPDLWATVPGNSTVKTSVDGISAPQVPSRESIDRDGYYEDNANIVIINDIIYQGGNPLIQGDDPDSADIPSNTITHSDACYNNREEKYVRMTEIDLRKLAGYKDTDPDGSPSFPTNHLPANGLMYATRTDDDIPSGEQPGIRLKNSKDIYPKAGSGGLTVVSNQPMYLQGDFNAPDDPANRKPVSVVADALNLLSNNWNDTNSTSDNLDARPTTETSYNCAFIAGAYESAVGTYNGGIENYPRLHEKWTDVNLNIQGSFTNLWDSEVGTGLWQYGDPAGEDHPQYTAPGRNWYYDPYLKDPTKLPPFTPYAVKIERGAWWQD